jgi:(p)ppGpp synthase/HD superfamily hydrolase
MQHEYEKARLYVRAMHAGQMHANNVPVWHHLERVSQALRYFLNSTNEGTLEAREQIITAALGHDLLEDTHAQPQEIKSIFGETGYQLIQGMTNEWGDHNVGPYVQKITTGPEEVRLIKLSDLQDNLSSVTYTIAVLTPEWTKNIFLPIVSPMREAILPTVFARYPDTAAALKFAVVASATRLEEELARF